MRGGCRQRARRHLSVEIPGAAPGLRPGLPLPGARDLDGQQAPRPRLCANRNRLLSVPRPGASAGKALYSPSTALRGQRGGTGQGTPGECPGAPASTSWQAFPPQKYNADYDLSARQGADTLAFMSLLEEKLLPVLVSVPRPPWCSWPVWEGARHSPRPPGLGAARGSEARPESSRCTGSDLPLPSRSPTADTYFLGRHQELRGSDSEVVRGSHALSP